MYSLGGDARSGSKFLIHEKPNNLYHRQPLRSVQTSKHHK